MPVVLAFRQLRQELLRKLEASLGHTVQGQPELRSETLKNQKTNHRKRIYAEKKGHSMGQEDKCGLPVSFYWSHGHRFILPEILCGTA